MAGASRRRKGGREGLTSSIVHVVVHIQARLLGVQSETGVRVVGVGEVHAPGGGVDVVMRKHLQQEPDQVLPNLLSVALKSVEVRVVRQAGIRRRGGRLAAGEECRTEDDVLFGRGEGDVLGTCVRVGDALVVGVSGAVECERELFGCCHA